jgi:hypothetical protein
MIKEPSRVKGRDSRNNHAIPSVSIERGAERGGNMHLFCRHQPAPLPHFEINQGE